MKTEIITAPAGDAVLAAKAAPASTKLDWLFEFDQISQQENTPKQRTASEEAVDQLLAADWG